MDRPRALTVRAIGAEPAVRDYGLLEAAAALMHSLAHNHALIDGNNRLALAAVIAFYGVNGRRPTLTNDEAYQLIMDVAMGDLDAVDDIAARLSTATEPGPFLMLIRDSHAFAASQRRP